LRDFRRIAVRAVSTTGDLGAKSPEAYGEQAVARMQTDLRPVFHGVLAENAHPFDEKPIGMSSRFGPLPESEELVSVPAEKAVPW